MKRFGFTVVELLIVIVVISILATITVVSYYSVRDSAALAKVQTDLSSINDGIKIYHAKKGHYPKQGAWIYSCQNHAAFASAIDEYMDSVPAAPCSGADGQSDTWAYRSDAAGTGSDYKLVHLKPSSIQSVRDQVPNELRDPVQYSTTWPQGTWGYWSPGGANYKVAP